MKSNLFSLILEIEAPIRLIVLIKRPVGLASTKGNPNQNIKGTKTIAEPTPPKANKKLKRKAKIVINNIEYNEENKKVFSIKE